MIGEVPGLEEGNLFKDRKALHDAGVHAGTQGGIGGGGESIVLSLLLIKLLKGSVCSGIVDLSAQQ